MAPCFSTRLLARPTVAYAIDNAARDEITGKAVTPYLLDNLFHLTDGRSLKTNIALVENNARLAAEIAVAMID